MLSCGCFRMRAEYWTRTVSSLYTPVFGAAASLVLTAATSSLPRTTVNDNVVSAVDRDEIRDSCTSPAPVRSSLSRRDRMSSDKLALSMDLGVFFATTEKLYLASHGCVLHGTVRTVAGQLLPPAVGSVVTLRSSISCPPPHKALQPDVAAQSPTTQSTGQE